MTKEHIGRTCPYDQVVIKPQDDVVVCSQCGVAHHRECWKANSGCTTVGCSTKQAQTDQGSPDHSNTWSVWAKTRKRGIWGPYLKCSDLRKGRWFVRRYSFRTAVPAIPEVVECYEAFRQAVGEPNIRLHYCHWEWDFRFSLESKILIVTVECKGSYLNIRISANTDVAIRYASRLVAAIGETPFTIQDWDRFTRKVSVSRDRALTPDFLV